MNYEKAYKEALERAKIWQGHLYEVGDKDYADELNYIFPELKESEDEKIRKTLIEYFNAYPKDYFGGLKKSYIVAWLEKQGGTSKEWTISDAATLKELIDFLENGTAKLQHDLTRYANWLKIQFTPIEKKSE